MTEGARPAVLIVDDVDTNLVALEAILEPLDCDLVRAQSGNEALGLLLKRTFALMLLDVQMPAMDGYEVARHSRSNATTRDVPIIFITAASEDLETELEGYGTGAVDFLFKPVNGYILRSKVQVFLELFLGRRRLDQEVAAHRRTLATLEHSNTALRHFTRAASHDLGAPLQAMIGFLSALERRADGALDDRGMHYLRRAQNATERMRGLLDSLLVFAGLRRASIVEDFDCTEVLDQVREDLADSIEREQVTLVVRGLPKVTGDRGRVYQLFLNLVGNAIKYRRAGVAACVDVRCEERVDGQVLCVEDNGIGIAPEHRERIFDAFQRLHARDVHEGAGLGLAICREIVEQHGGRIWIESAQRAGVRFCFTLEGEGQGA